MQFVIRSSCQNYSGGWQRLGLSSPTDILEQSCSFTFSFKNCLNLSIWTQLLCGSVPQKSNIPKYFGKYYLRTFWWLQYICLFSMGHKLCAVFGMGQVSSTKGTPGLCFACFVLGQVRISRRKAFPLVRNHAYLLGAASVREYIRRAQRKAKYGEDGLVSQEQERLFSSDFQCKLLPKF